MSGVLPLTAWPLAWGRSLHLPAQWMGDHMNDVSLLRSFCQQHACLNSIFFLMFLMFMFERETETERERGRGQKERETQNRKQVPGTELSAQSPTRGWNPRTVEIMHGLSRRWKLNRLSHPGALIP